MVKGMSGGEVRVGQKAEGLPSQKLDPNLSGRACCVGGLGANTAKLELDRCRVKQCRTNANDYHG